MLHTLNIVPTLLLVFSLLTGQAVPAVAGVLPPEPDDALLINEDVNVINGLYTREYSLSGDEIIDYKTARQIVNFYHNDYGNTVVDTSAFPLFYWYDANHDGEFNMWVDQKVEGCACDIVPYDWRSEN